MAASFSAISAVSSVSDVHCIYRFWFFLPLLHCMFLYTAPIANQHWIGEKPSIHRTKLHGLFCIEPYGKKVCGTSLGSFRNQSVWVCQEIFVDGRQTFSWERFLVLSLWALYKVSSSNLRLQQCLYTYLLPSELFCHWASIQVKREWCLCWNEVARAGK